MDNKYAGSSFDDFLEEEEILEEVSARALIGCCRYSLNRLCKTTRSAKRFWQKI